MNEENREQPPTAAQVCADLSLGDEAVGLLREEFGGEQYLNLLVERLLFDDAIKVLARYLAKQASVRWACDCLLESQQRGESVEDPDCLEAALAWCQEPSEERRVAALDIADRSGYQTAAAWAAAGAGWSGGSLAPPGTPVIPPPEDLTAKAIAGAVALLASQQPDEFPQRQMDYVRKGMEMARQPGCVGPGAAPGEGGG